MTAMTKERQSELDRVMKSLRHRDGGVRYDAAFTLGRLGTAAARPDIVEQLLKGLDDIEMQSAAADALRDLMNYGARFFRSNRGLTVAWVRDLAQ